MCKRPIAPGWGLVFLAACSAPARAEAPEDKERLAALVAYVGADYGLAIHARQIVAPAEYREQRERVYQARGLASRLVRSGQLDAHIEDQLALLSTAVERRDDETLVAQVADQVVRSLADAGVALDPVEPIDRARGATLYASHCAPCHGPDGRADTPTAKTLRPPPASFLDERRMRRITPALAYLVITFGVDDTGMPAFSDVPVSSRWDLAHYVLSMRTGSVEYAAGATRSVRAVAPRWRWPARFAGAALTLAVAMALLGRRRGRSVGAP